MEIYKKDKILEEKDTTIRSLMSENKLLHEKTSSIETDLKVVLNNRSKLDNLEDVIVRFLKDDQEINESFKSMMSSNNPKLMSYNNPNMMMSPNNQNSNMMTHNNTHVMTGNNPNFVSPSSNIAGKR